MPSFRRPHQVPPNQNLPSSGPARPVSRTASPTHKHNSAVVQEGRGRSTKKIELVWSASRDLVPEVATRAIKEDGKGEISRADLNGKEARNTDLVPEVATRAIKEDGKGSCLSDDHVIRSYRTREHNGTRNMHVNVRHPYGGALTIQVPLQAQTGALPSCVSRWSGVWSSHWQRPHAHEHPSALSLLGCTRLQRDSGHCAY